MVVSVSIILVGALIFWLLLSRGASRVRKRYETLLSIAAQSSDPVSEMESVQRKITALRLLVNTSRYVLAFFVVLMVLRRLDIADAATLLFPAGFLGAALGLGGQNLVRDVVAGLFMVFENQFAVGDIVSINGTLGSVEEVGLRVTRLRDDSGQIYYFPNGAITTVSKFPSRGVPLLLWVPLAPDASLERASQTVDNVLDSVNEFLPNSITKVKASVFQSPGTEEILVPAPNGEENSSPILGDVQWLCWQFQANPARTAMLREKLPGRVTTALQTAGIGMATGAVIEIVTAPAEVSS